MTNQPTPRDLVNVKALKWDDCGRDIQCGYIPSGHCTMFYSVVFDRGLWYSQLHRSDYDRVHIAGMLDTIHAAQAACQAHYEQTVYDSLEAR